MLFSSPAFLFAFLPGFLLAYFITPSKLRNLLLLTASLLFYFSSSGQMTLWLILSILLNYLLGRAIARLRGSSRKLVLAAGVALNLLPLFYYKYAAFAGMSVQNLFSLFGLPLRVPELHPVLPIGISFFTFQAISYIADIYMMRVAPARSLIDFGMYHACFPQLIAGPIVRYEEIAAEVHRRSVRLDDIYNGVVQFSFGLAKKVILADSMGSVADPLFGPHAGQLPPLVAWCAALAYSLQIYFDFSGYSDMAIGIGRVLGFHYPENFNQPYLSTSVTDFWRRWHMTLSRWFRDYLYIPVGGNRQGRMRTLLNLQLVFLLCGLWHGAGYTFVVWGLYHGALLTAERLLARPLALLRARSGGLVWSLAGWCYTSVAVMVGWVLFRSPTIAQAGPFLRSMFALHGWGNTRMLVPVLTADKAAILLVASIIAILPYRRLVEFSDRRYRFQPFTAGVSLLLAVLAITMMSVNGFNPFIYFRF